MLRVSLGGSRLTKFLINGIHMYSSKSIYKNIFVINKSDEFYLIS
jgi:hypothetical protein